VQINYSESYGGKGLLADLYSFATLESWFNAILNNEAIFAPLDFNLSVGDKEYLLIASGICDVVEYSKALIEIRELPLEKKIVPNDYLSIQANKFTRELCVKVEDRI
jgi:hypothetical protein